MTSQPHPLADVIITCQVKICCKCYDFLYHIFLNIQRVFESKNGKLKTQSQSKLRRDIYIYIFLLHIKGGAYWVIKSLPQCTICSITDLYENNSTDVMIALDKFPRMVGRQFTTFIP